MIEEWKKVMPTYRATFAQHSTYTIEATDDNAALDTAEEKFKADMRCPVAVKSYDDIEIEELEL